MKQIKREILLPFKIEQAFAFFADARNLESITPSFLNFKIIEAPDEIDEGALLRYRLKLFQIPIYWKTRIIAWRPPYFFIDMQLKGPYRFWVHQHRFESRGRQTFMQDIVDYQTKGSIFSPAINYLFIERQVNRIFDYRAERIIEEMKKVFR